MFERNVRSSLRELRHQPALAKIVEKLFFFYFVPFINTHASALRCYLINANSKSQRHKHMTAAVCPLGDPTVSMSTSNNMMRE